MRRVRVLLVDDHKVLREGLRALLNNYADIEVVGEAGDGREALKKATRLEPDVVVMDISMAGMDGIEATRRLRRFPSAPHVVVLTQHDEPQFVSSLLEAGAAGYVLKRMGGASVAEAVRSVSKEGAYLPPGVARQMLQRNDRNQGREQVLTPREREVLRLVAQGLTSQEIADRLVLSAKTVSVHRTNIMRKLGLHKNTELVRYALRQGLVDL